MRDPNQLTGQSETELARKAAKRKFNSSASFFAKKLWQYWWVIAFAMAAIASVVVAFFQNEPEYVTKFGSLVILAGAASNYWIANSARGELDDGISKNRDMNYRSIAQYEARLVLKHAFPAADVTNMAPPPDWQPHLQNLERSKLPFLILEVGLVLVGTAISIFGDLATCFYHTGVWTKC